MSSVAVLGSSGMLGSTVAKVLTENGHKVLELNRSGVASCEKNEVAQFSAEKVFDLEPLLISRKICYIVNCVGLIKQRFNEGSEIDSLRAAEINSHLPGQLQTIVDRNNMKMIQIGTDCVFSGLRGHYSELDKFDPIDLYGKTKLEGEQNSLRSMILRTSVIGIEKNTSYSLLSWLLSQAKGSEINGFSNHFWNGVTTLDFGRIVSGIVASDYFLPGITHVVPSNVVSKYQILQEASRVFDREDLYIRESEAPQSVNRSLTTMDSSRNRYLWSLGGYNRVPKLEEMIQDYSSWFKSNQK
jgi:dTDP-4-dehydrorhamnose reductase